MRNYKTRYKIELAKKRLRKKTEMVKYSLLARWRKSATAIVAAAATAVIASATWFFTGKNSDNNKQDNKKDKNTTQVAATKRALPADSLVVKADSKEVKKIKEENDNYGGALKRKEKETTVIAQNDNSKEDKKQKGSGALKAPKTAKEREKEFLASKGLPEDSFDKAAEKAKEVKAKEEERKKREAKEAAARKVKEEKEAAERAKAEATAAAAAKINVADNSLDEDRPSINFKRKQLTTYKDIVNYIDNTTVEQEVDNKVKNMVEDYLTVVKKEVKKSQKAGKGSKAWGTINRERSRNVDNNPVSYGSCMYSLIYCMKQSGHKELDIFIPERGSGEALSCPNYQKFIERQLKGSDARKHVGYVNVLDFKQTPKGSFVFYDSSEAASGRHATVCSYNNGRKMHRCAFNNDRLDVDFDSPTRIYVVDVQSIVKIREMEKVRGMSKIEAFASLYKDSKELAPFEIEAFKAVYAEKTGKTQAQTYANRINVRQ